MNVHLISHTQIASLVTFGTGGMNANNVCIDPREALTGFTDFWRNCGDHSCEFYPRALRHYEAQMAFYSRDHFTQCLKDICKEDVYVQSSSYEMTICFTIKDDLTEFNTFINENPPLKYPATLHNEISTWLTEASYQIKKDYNIISKHGEGIFFIADRELMALLSTKFYPEYSTLS